MLTTNPSAGRYPGVFNATPPVKPAGEGPLLTDALLFEALRRRNMTTELLSMQASETEDTVVGYLDVAPAGYQGLIRRVEADVGNEASRLVTEAVLAAAVAAGIIWAAGRYGHGWTSFPWIVGIIAAGLVSLFLLVRCAKILRNGYGMGAVRDMEEMAGRMFGTGVKGLHYAGPDLLGTITYLDVREIHISRRGDLARVSVIDRAGKEVTWMDGVELDAALAFAEDVNARKESEVP